jgi:hypothetical protein
VLVVGYLLVCTHNEITAEIGYDPLAAILVPLENEEQCGVVTDAIVSLKRSSDERATADLWALAEERKEPWISFLAKFGRQFGDPLVYRAEQCLVVDLALVARHLADPFPSIESSKALQLAALFVSGDGSRTFR